MSTPARIDELRKKFDENPRRYFAPLANEYRKAGDLAQAIALCREYLPKQPGHMSGHIVFGQALYEAGELDEARSVFESALALDPENLIALRHLGDIAKVGGDAAGARRWYERVLDADPRNDDIAAQLATLATGNTPMSSPAVQGPPDTFARSWTRGTETGAPGEHAAAAPEPDPSMRAVDFDVVNAHVARSTPLYSETIAARAQSVGESGSPPAGGSPSDDAAERPSSQAADSFSQPAARRDFEPLDLDAMDSADDTAWSAPTLVPAGQDGQARGDSWSDQAESDGMHPVVSALDATASADEPEVQDAPAGFSGNDIGEVADEPARATADSALADAQRDFEQTESGRHEERASADARAGDTVSDGVYDSDFGGTEFDDDEFEGGILAPEWPQASELIAKIGTPRSSTPVSVRVTPDAVAAFGREPHDTLPEPSSAPEYEHEEAGAHASRSQSASEPVDAAPGNDAHVAMEHSAVADSSHDDQAAHDASEESPANDLAVEDSAANEPEVSTDGVETAVAPTPVSEVPVDEQGDDVQSRAVAESESETDSFDAVPVAAEEGDSDNMLSAPPATREETYADRNVEGTEEPEEASFADVLSYDDGGSAKPPARPEPSTAFVTETMGELLVSQGFIERAVDVYEELVRRRPYDPVLTSRLAELREQLETPAAEMNAASAAAHSPTPASTPAFSMTPPRSFTPRHVTPQSFTPRSFTPRATPAVSSSVDSPPGTSQQANDAGVSEPVVTARELFARLAARRVPRRTPPGAVPAIQGSADDLSSLFGRSGDQRDDSAARALADAFAPIGADAMADGATMDFGVGVGRSRTPLPSPVSTVERAPSQASTNASGGAAPAAATGSTSFSFDRFFPDPASRSTANPAKVEPASSPAPASDDLAEFSAWLKGLGNK
jgi:tetratricopeptide (TPR) repeat protein